MIICKLRFCLFDMICLLNKEVDIFVEDIINIKLNLYDDCNRKHIFKVEHNYLLKQ